MSKAPANTTPHPQYPRVVVMEPATWSLASCPKKLVSPVRGWGATMNDREGLFFGPGDVEETHERLLADRISMP
jgi:hypothetical protein